jgi:hypothetical protein
MAASTISAATAANSANSAAVDGDLVNVLGYVFLSDFLAIGVVLVLIWVLFELADLFYRKY